MNGKRIAWTKDDQLITLRAIKRGQFATFNEMVEADDTAAHQMYEHEAGKHLDEYQAGMIEHDLHVGQILDLLDKLGIAVSETVLH